MAVVYRHIRLDKNEPFYIGIGKTERRAFRKDFRNKYWRHIISQTEYKVEILFDDLTWEQACQKEIELIKLYGRKDLGLGTLVNMTDGADGGLGTIPSKETRKKMSLSLKGKVRSNEAKERYSLVAKNRTYSEDTRKKMSDAKKGKIGNRLGTKASDETKLKISESKKNTASWNKGVKLSEKHKENLRLAWIKRKEKQNNG
jgi:hypothetical protein